MPYLLSKTALTIEADETQEDFEARKAAHEAEWHRPSFAQQVLAAAQEDADFLRQTSRG